MYWLVGLIAAAMAAFAIASAVREGRLYRRALRGEVQYLISRKRLVRRIMISVILLAEACFLVFGFFLLGSRSPGIELLFWMAPLILVFVLFFLTFQDLHETRRDVDRIFREELRRSSIHHKATKSIKK